MHVSAQNCIGTEQCKPTRSELCGSEKWHIFLYLMCPNFRDGQYFFLITVTVNLCRTCMCATGLVW